jgi:8-oxo-dGTP pyrophosphatase MutT (NUDIX family)
LFNEEGKVLVVNTVGNWQVPGGKPEGDESVVETLIRECLEEADAEIKDITPLGYQYVRQITDKGLSKKIGQIRFAAKIKELKNLTADPATGKVPERKFIDVRDFLDYCPWGKIGHHVVKLGKKKLFDLNE